VREFWEGIGSSSRRRFSVAKGEVIRGVWGGPLPHGSATPYDAIVDPPFTAEWAGLVEVDVDWMQKTASVRYVESSA
jgi:hypothetical protein